MYCRNRLEEPKKEADSMMYKGVKINWKHCQAIGYEIAIADSGDIFDPTYDPNLASDETIGYVIIADGEVQTKFTDKELKVKLVITHSSRSGKSGQGILLIEYIPGLTLKQLPACKIGFGGWRKRVIKVTTNAYKKVIIGCGSIIEVIERDRMTPCVMIGYDENNQLVQEEAELIAEWGVRITTLSKVIGTKLPYIVDDGKLWDIFPGGWYMIGSGEEIIRELKKRGW